MSAALMTGEGGDDQGHGRGLVDGRHDAAQELVGLVGLGVLARWCCPMLARHQGSTWWTLISWLRRTRSLTFWDSCRFSWPCGRELARDRRASGRRRKNSALDPDHDRDRGDGVDEEGRDDEGEQVEARRQRAGHGEHRRGDLGGVAADDLLEVALALLGLAGPASRPRRRRRGRCAGGSRVSVLMREARRASASWTTRRAMPRPVAMRNRSQQREGLVARAGPSPTSTSSLSEEMAKATWTMTTRTPASRKPASTPCTDSRTSRRRAWPRPAARGGPRRRGSAARGATLGLTPWRPRRWRPWWRAGRRPGGGAPGVGVSGARTERRTERSDVEVDGGRGVGRRTSGRPPACGAGPRRR